MAATNKPVLVLGGGINGAAVARELLLNGVSVVLVDTADIASGTTAYSSRLIHGGLRYLEHGEFDLVRESLDERTRLLRLAPQFVQPLRLFIPIERRLGGLRQATERFFGRAKGTAAANKPRGLWLVRIGLWLYDRYARGSSLPPRGAHRAGQSDVPPVNERKYRWLCSYSDAQISFPERFVVAMLEDARQLASEQAIRFDVLTYHRAEFKGKAVEIFPLRPTDDEGPTVSLEPTAIVNATGAWIDRTLKQLQVSSRRLIGGTRGSHLVTDNETLVKALDGRGIYAEAADGRPVFILPYGNAALIGTTDIAYDGDPAAAVASDQELDYLLEAVQEVFPQVKLSRDDVRLHCCGVRPLPYVEATTPASITRRHIIDQRDEGQIAMFSLIGGKLSTCRSLAEETVAAVLQKLGSEAKETSRDRPVPGGESYPRDRQALIAEQQRLADSLGWKCEQVKAVWRLIGTRTSAVIEPVAQSSGESLPGVLLPVQFARHAIRHEWVRRLSDLVERRLMLLYDSRLSVDCLRRLADLMVEEGTLQESRVESEVRECVERLRAHFGLRVENTTELN